MYQWHKMHKPARLQTQSIRGKANQSITDDQKHCQSRVLGSTGCDVNIVSSRITGEHAGRMPRRGLYT